MIGRIELALLLGVAGLLVLAVTATALRSARRDRRHGRLLSVDTPAAPGRLLRSERWKLAGRPDAIRVRPDGRSVPIEVKSRPAPRRGPPDSHVAQLWAYCLLLEESTGRAPPYGVLRYGDGREYELPWDEAARSWLWQVRRAVGRPYAGEDRASPGRCSRCVFRSRCDRAVA